MTRNSRGAKLTKELKWRTMKVAGQKAAKDQSYIMWFILGVLGHFITIAWASIETPRMPMAIDEESPTGNEDHETFERAFQEKAKAERKRYAWMGTAAGGPLHILATAFMISNAITDSGVFDRERFASTAPTEQAEPTNTANAGAGAVEAPANVPAVPALETEPEVASVRIDENDDAEDAESRATAEVLAGYDCTESTESGVFNCTERAGANAWVEPTGTWRGTYRRRGTTNHRTVEIQFNEQTTTRYPESTCSGNLTPTGETPDSGEGREYRETLTERGTCINNGLVTLKYAGVRGTVLAFEWRHGNRWRRRVWEGVLSKVEF